MHRSWPLRCIGAVKPFRLEQRIAVVSGDAPVPANDGWSLAGGGGSGANGSIVSPLLDHDPVFAQELQHAFRPAEMQRPYRDEYRLVGRGELQHPRDEAAVAFVDDLV